MIQKKVAYTIWKLRIYASFSIGFMQKSISMGLWMAAVSYFPPKIRVSAASRICPFSAILNILKKDIWLWDAVEAKPLNPPGIYGLFETADQ